MTHGCASFNTSEYFALAWWPSLLSNAALSVHERDRICVVRRNGCGKSTLLKIASGDILPDEGQRFLQTGMRVIYVPQEPTPGDAKTVFDYVVAALPPARHFLARSLITEVGLTPDKDAAALSGGEMPPSSSSVMTGNFSKTCRVGCCGFIRGRPIA